MKIRKSERDRRGSELAQALQAERMLAERITRLRADQQELRSQARYSSQPGKIVVDDLIVKKRYELQLRVDLEKLRGQLSVVRQEVQRRRDNLAHADREVSVLEKLRSKQLFRHRLEEMRQEQKSIDETAVIRAVSQGAD